MNEHDDLFDKNPSYSTEQHYLNNQKHDNFNNDFYEKAINYRHNGLLIAIYIAVQLLVAFIAGVIISSQYTYLDHAIEDVQIINDINYIVYDNINSETNEIDEINPFRINLKGKLINNSEYVIPVLSIKVEFFDEDGKSLGIQILSKDNFGVNQTYEIDEILYSSVKPYSIKREISAQPPTILNVIIQLVYATIVAVLFFIVDKASFKQDAKLFKIDPKRHTTSIFIGFILLYAAMIFANIIMEILGVTQTSNNEMIIRSLFSSNPINLGLLFLMTVVTVPIVEEVVFRKALFGLIEPKTNHIVAIILSGAIFAFMHIQGDYIQMIPYTAMGIVLGYSYWKSGRNIYVSIGVHMLNNFVSWLLYVFMVYGIVF